MDWIASLGADLASLSNSIAQFPITYYFYLGEPETALAGFCLIFWSSPNVPRDRGLQGCIFPEPCWEVPCIIFSNCLPQDFLSMPVDDKQAIMRAYAREQMSDPIILQRTIPHERKPDAA
jgi:hypothetical protein